MTMSLTMFPSDWYRKTFYLALAVYVLYVCLHAHMSSSMNNSVFKIHLRDYSLSYRVDARSDGASIRVGLLPYHHHDLLPASGFLRVYN